MEGLDIPDVDFTSSLRKRRKTAPPSGEPSATGVVVSRSVVSQKQRTIPRRRSEREKEKVVEKSAGKVKEPTGGDKVQEEDIFYSVFHNYKLKRAVRNSDSVNDDPSVGLALLGGLCLPRDVEGMPKSRNGLISSLAAQIAMTAQTAAVCFDKIAEADQVREDKLAELNEVHWKILEGMKQQIVNAKALFEKESAEKARAEANCAEALKELSDYRAGEAERLRTSGQAVMQATIDKLRKNVEDAMDTCRQEGMEQGFRLGCEWGLKAMNVPKESPL